MKLSDLNCSLIQDSPLLKEWCFDEIEIEKNENMQCINSYYMALQNSGLVSFENRQCGVLEATFYNAYDYHSWAQSVIEAPLIEYVHHVPWFIRDWTQYLQEDSMSFQYPIGSNAHVCYFLWPWELNWMLQVMNVSDIKILPSSYTCQSLEHYNAKQIEYYGGYQKLHNMRQKVIQYSKKYESLWYSLVSMCDFLQLDRLQTLLECLISFFL